MPEGGAFHLTYPRKIHALWSVSVRSEPVFSRQETCHCGGQCALFAAACRANTPALANRANLLSQGGLDVSSLDWVSILKGIAAGWRGESGPFRQPALQPAR
jgi:hypothetical protein